MLHLQDKQNNIFKATVSREPNLYSGSKWFSVTRYIDDKPYNFYYIKSNGSCFYFLYQGKWHRMHKGSIFNEDAPTKYIRIK